MLFDWAAVRTALPSVRLLDEPLGRGASSVVLRGEDWVYGAVAVKVLPPEAVGDARHEASILATKLDHPHIVKVLYGSATNEIAAIVMELLPGGSLRTRLRQGRVTPEWACAVVLAVAAALDSAHHVLLHRDVKPENILFTADDQPKLADFGIARAFEGSVVNSTWPVGTWRYMAPEQFRADALRNTTDIYALGLVAYELLTGRPPFHWADATWESHRQCHENVQPPALIGVANPIARVVLRALRKDPADRPQDARAFFFELAAAAAAALGPDWLARADVRLELADDLAAALRPPGQAPASPPAPRAGAGGAAGAPATQPVTLPSVAVPSVAVPPVAVPSVAGPRDAVPRDAPGRPAEPTADVAGVAAAAGRRLQVRPPLPAVGPGPAWLPPQRASSTGPRPAPSADTGAVRARTGEDPGFRLAARRGALRVFAAVALIVAVVVLAVVMVH
ncbi:serine/threonine-protein kinase [Pseudofrankia inefficax]|uniref:Serine/threonine protein kinase n=1 Tax=Pseudofrankia inefficax (strain DSM 45817 / CECT 9037 / DDB 130130 / EuI1c) TaxID=298654 RepID=E3JDJ7_PSEI1|nr:serine/threonine-protein kinase [Pseudofrankia inefficax]ADP84763.1 serine/threonine protein kinase [Pseudofrankia inefficax]